MSAFKKNKNKTLKLRLGHEMGQTPSILILHIKSRTYPFAIGPNPNFFTILTNSK